MRILKIVTDLVADGRTFVGAVAPLLSIAYTALKFFDLDTPARDVLREMSYGWALAPLTAWLVIAYVRRHAAHEALASAGNRASFTPDFNPKEALRHLCQMSIWSERFDDEHKLFEAAQLALRDELVAGTRVRAKGRESGKWGDGAFRNPSDFIDPQWWKHGDLNWIRILNFDYSGDIDAYDNGYKSGDKRSYDDVMLCRREIEATWPAKSVLRRWLRPSKFKIFIKPESRPPPWMRRPEGEASANSPAGSEGKAV